MPYIIILKARKFHQSTINRSGTAGKKPVEGHNVPSPSLNRVNTLLYISQDREFDPGYFLNFQIRFSMKTNTPVESPPSENFMKLSPDLLGNLFGLMPGACPWGCKQLKLTKTVCLKTSSTA